MTDYSKACVYKIVCKDENITDTYIGSTKNFKNRMKGHKCNCNNIKRPEYNYKVYKFIRENGGWENWEMKKICDVKCLNKYDLHKKEGDYQRELKPTLNKGIAGRTNEEYREDNRDKRSVYQKAYDLKNRDKINKQRRERRAKKKATQSSLLG